MHDYETLLTETTDNGVFRLTLNRPERLNAITDTMWAELEDVLKQLRRDAAIRVVVISGAGTAFCSGADISGGPRPEPRPHLVWKLRLLADVAMSLHTLPQPTIAQVNGVAAGAGCNLALGCDLVVASDQARFSEIFSQRGLSPDLGGTWLLPRLIGLHKAKELAYFGDVIDAATAERFGLVNRVVPAAELHAVVDDWARRLSERAPIALAHIKTLLNQSIAPSLAESLVAEGSAQIINNGTDDTKEAMAAYREKRAPLFTGR